MITNMTNESLPTQPRKGLKYSFIGLWIALFLLASGFLGLELQRELEMTEAQRISRFWSLDMAKLGREDHLHTGFNSLKSFEFFTPSELATEWAKNLEVPFTTRDDGKYHLEILVLSHEDEGERAVVIQMDLVDLETNNLVWEVGRTYSLEFF